MTLRLPVDLYSADQLSTIIIELRNYVGDLHDFSVRKKLGKDHTEEPPHISALLLAVLHGADAKQGDLAAAEELLKELQSVRKQAPVVHITLPDLPNRTLKRQFTVWFRSEISPCTLLTFAMRSDIGGGAIIQAGSHIYDFSLKAQILNNRARISEIYQNV